MAQEGATAASGRDTGAGVIAHGCQDGYTWNQPGGWAISVTEVEEYAAQAQHDQRDKINTQLRNALHMLIKMKKSISNNK